MKLTLKKRPLLNPAFKRVQRLPAPLAVPSLAAFNVAGRMGDGANAASLAKGHSRRAEEKAMPA